jgi:hypothetical protein
VDTMGARVIRCRTVIAAPDVEAVMACRTKSFHHRLHATDVIVILGLSLIRRTSDAVSLFSNFRLRRCV